MTKSERTLLFNIIVGLFNIVIGLLIEGFLILAGYILLADLTPEARESVPVNVLLPFVLLIGLIAAMSISRSCVIWALDKFNLREKLDSNLLKRYPRKKL